MNCIVEITKYPLTPEYETPILDFIQRINAYDGLEITTGETSTVIRGDYDHVMDVLTKEMKTSLGGSVRTSFVVKVLNLA